MDLGEYWEETAGSYCDNELKRAFLMAAVWPNFLTNYFLGEISSLEHRTKRDTRHVSATECKIH